MKVLAISGSLRKNSFNSGLIRAAADLAPEGMLIEQADISAVPLYNGDEDGDSKPAAVDHLADQIRNADALIIATPEYNFSIPGVLKNAIDWLSRVPGSIFAGKPAAIMGAAMGGMGTSRSQYHLRQVLVYLDVHPLNKPEVFVSAAHQKCDENGNLTDEKTREMIAKQLQALKEWHATLKG
ncbi:NAD(P)H-dependent oxidoreductase [Alcanivorax sp. S6407]|uniref:NADPH-dependent FMN reductase n=1 Tax=Alcanivorax sp. S6407 TaxID=2926424 RepID=UPI001FF5A8B2|nr:NADPH-dependent FMN reductase [Alcanivorax sp. S6407]MCK0154420.1 NAD(P)H-dependent oxidoreductase [Alcanivorax sp. S6407]